jgi:hypothetical protein
VNCRLRGSGRARTGCEQAGACQDETPQKSPPPWFAC